MSKILATGGTAYEWSFKCGRGGTSNGRGVVDTCLYTMLMLGSLLGN